MDLGNKIKFRLDDLRKTVPQTAEETGLSKTYLYEVIRGVKGLGVDSAKKLAPALEWPVSELLETSTDELGTWFWSARIGQLTDRELEDLKAGSPISRVQWTLQQVGNHFPSLDLPNLIQTSPAHVEQMLAGKGAATGMLVTMLTNSLHLPLHWITLGEPGPSDLLVKKVLQHHNADAWLRIMARAMEQNIPPSAIDRMLTAFLDIVENK